MKHVIVIETPDEIHRNRISTIIDKLELIFNDDEGLIQSHWNQEPDTSLTIPNATANGEPRLVDI